jgi:hypothetical protein
VFYSHDAGHKGYLRPGELRAMLKRLEPEEGLYSCCIQFTRSFKAPGFNSVRLTLA